jgi:hypothetical protein
MNDHQDDGRIPGSIVWDCTIDITCMHNLAAAASAQKSFIGMPSHYGPG